MARPPVSEDDDLPWLAEGVREERATIVPRARLLGGGVVAVALAGLVALGVYFASGHKSDGSSGYARPEDAPLIAADAGAYKVVPTDPGGAQIGGIDDAIAATAGGTDQGSAIVADDAEEPLARPLPGTTAPTATVPPPVDLLPPASRAPAAPAVVPVTIAPAPVQPPARTAAAVPAVKPTAGTPTPKPVVPATKPEPQIAANRPPPAPAAKPAKPHDDPLASPAEATKPADVAKPKAAAGTDAAKLAVSPDAPAKGSVALQLGAFSTRDKAEAAWTKAGGDGALSGLAKRIEPVERDGKTLYRLRAGGVASRDAARALCARLAAAGHACIVAE